MNVLSGIALWILHAGRSGSFPEALSKEKEEELLKKSEAGDKSARRLLIEHNLRLVAHIAKKYYGAADQDDLISIGTIGLIKAVSTYKSDKGIHLATYASRCIENATLSQMSFWLQKELPIGAPSVRKVPQGGSCI